MNTSTGSQKDENSIYKKLLDRVENIVTQSDIAYYEHFSFCHYVFKNSSAAEKVSLLKKVWQNKKSLYIELIVSIMIVLQLNPQIFSRQTILKMS